MLKLIITLTLLFSLSACEEKKQHDEIFQVSSLYHLEKQYDGFVSYKEIKKHGDFGIGTFDKINGEMVALNGKFYQVTSNGKISSAKNKQKSPYATVNFFKANQEIELKKTLRKGDLEAFIEHNIERKDLANAIKIRGKFRYLKLRVHAKKPKPYNDLANTLAHQKIFEVGEAKGTLVGYRTADMTTNTTLPKYHFHFISDDEKHGGHVLDLEIRKGKLSIDTIYSVKTIYKK
jgi:acetolactate decarboxylase